MLPGLRQRSANMDFEPMTVWLSPVLPNESDYLELVYACAWLGLIAVPVNTRLSITEIDHLIADANPRGLIRHSSLPVPTMKPSWELVLDKEPLDLRSDSHPDAIYDPEAILALIYTSGTTGHPKGVVVTHANIMANVDHINYWKPLSRRRRAPSRRADFSHLGLSIHVLRTGVRRPPSDNPEVQPAGLMRNSRT